MELIAVTNRALCHQDFLQQLYKLANAQIAAIILREKDLSAEAYLQLAYQCQQVLQPTAVPLILNGHIAAARQLGIDAVQLSYQNFAVQREQLQDFSRVMVSVHSVQEGQQAAQWGAHALIAGHIFSTDCKKGVPPRGMSFLDQVCNAVTAPVYAIGGITADTLPLVQQSKAAGACIMSQAMQENFFWFSY